MIRFTHKGDFRNTTNFLKRMKQTHILQVLNKYGQKGVAALSAATPKDTGLTADSWYYKVETTNASATLTFYNSNVNNGVPIAIILQYGHGTRNGGWVEGVDYINPAIQPIFNQILQEVWGEVTKP